MRYGYSDRLREDLNAQVLAALRSRGIINIATVAEEVRVRIWTRTSRSKTSSAS